MATKTRQRLIDTATRRFYRDGFRNVGLDQILTDVGISKTAFYKHFSCKDDLMLAVLDNHDTWFRDAFMDMIRNHGGEAAADQLYALMDVVNEIISSDDFHGCIFVNAAMEFPLAHDPAHAAAAKNKAAIESIVCEIARRAGAVEPEALASQLCLIVEGAYVTYQVTGNQLTVDIARSVAHRVIDAHLKSVKKTRSSSKAARTAGRESKRSAVAAS